jgi:hypothetical protein
MTKKIAEPAMASIRLIAEDSKSPLAMAGNLEVWHVWELRWCIIAKSRFHALEVWKRDLA